MPAKICRGKELTKRGQKNGNKCKELKMYDTDLDHKCAMLGRGREHIYLMITIGKYVGSA